MTERYPGPPRVTPDERVLRAHERTQRRDAMTRFGYTLMTEQSGPRELVRYAVAAEQKGEPAEPLLEGLHEAVP
ncbi:MAG TPA: hypothetical protein VFI19_06670 [Nocardioides sp.]|nr:hypothetical protein [Nocardioides sp.]